MTALQDLWTYLTTGSSWSGSEGIPVLLAQHLALTGVAVLIAFVLAVPLGVWLGHLGRGGPLATGVSNAARAVPTFAILVLLAIGPLGIGKTAVIVSLVLFALAPLLTNSYVAVAEVDRDVQESARGMGMSQLQVLRRVELPLGVPVLMTGIRIAVVQVIATATVAALIGGGGLGRLIVDGFETQNTGQLLTGAVLVAVLALTVDLCFAVLQRWLDPLRGVKSRSLGETGIVPTDDEVGTDAEPSLV